MNLTQTQLEFIGGALSQILPFSQPADVVISRLFRENKKLGARDRTAIAETVFGILRHLPRLEWLLAGKTPGSRELVCCYLACVDKRNARELGDMFNATLVEEAKRWKAARWEDAPLNVRAALPQWIVDALAADGHDEAAILALGQAMMKSAPLDLRVNTLKAKPDATLAALKDSGIDATMMPYSNIGIRVVGKPALNKHPLFLDGQIEVQDEGSQLLALLTGVKRGQMVTDFCAGAGGKTLALGAMMANTGRLYAFDVSEKRLSNLKPRLARSGLSNVQPQLIASESDQKIKRLAGKMDAVLVDAPCSGLGTLRRNPDLKYRQSPTSVAELNAKQAAILASAARLVKQGGRLVYATCSVLKSENDAIVEGFLAAHPDFELVDARELFAAARVDIQLDGALVKLSPNTHNTDGFFAAIMVRR
ncbi:RsmB/NOP family class I SAM-dependent RNA methyltransferase [Chitinibacteraceae bacterium HSL-7]